MGVGHRFAGIITIDVAANEPPVAGDDVLTGEGDVILTFAVAVLTANDSDPDGDEVTFINFLKTPPGVDSIGAVAVRPGSGHNRECLDAASRPTRRSFTP